VHNNNQVMAFLLIHWWCW